jgi:hypothetical protein
MTARPPEVVSFNVNPNKTSSKCHLYCGNPRIDAARFFLISAANIGPNRFHKKRTVSQLMSGEILKYRNWFFIRVSYVTRLADPSRVPQTKPLVRCYHVTNASVHDSQVLDADNRASNVEADSAYRSAEIETMLKGIRSDEPYPLHEGRRNKPLSKRQEQGNKTRSKKGSRSRGAYIQS